VLTHLSLAGPLTIGEAAQHLDRAQSVVSDIVSQLEGHGLLEREQDPADRRRTLVWLSPAGVARLAEDRQVLSVERLRRAMDRMSRAERDGLLAGVAALLDAARSDTPTQPRQEEH
jgi:DNA-binding MarR family transcriptional regulator